jgi:hypothetical protein
MALAWPVAARTSSTDAAKVMDAEGVAKGVEVTAIVTAIDTSWRIVTIAEAVAAAAPPARKPSPRLQVAAAAAAAPVR